MTETKIVNCKQVGERKYHVDSRDPEEPDKIWRTTVYTFDPEFARLNPYYVNHQKDGGKLEATASRG